MQRDRAIASADWAIEFLRFSPKLTKEQRLLWIDKAMNYSEKEWKEGVYYHYQNRKKDFEPALGLLCDTMKPERVEKKGFAGWPEGWEPDPKKTSAENYASFLDAKEEIKRSRNGN